MGETGGFQPSGATWTDTGVGPQSWQHISISGDGMKIAAVVNEGKIWISSNGGSSFAEVG